MTGNIIQEIGPVVDIEFDYYDPNFEEVVYILDEKGNSLNIEVSIVTHIKENVYRGVVDKNPENISILNKTCIASNKNAEIKEKKGICINENEFDSLGFEELINRMLSKNVILSNSNLDEDKIWIIKENINKNSSNNYMIMVNENKNDGWYRKFEKRKRL